MPMSDSTPDGLAAIRPHGRYRFSPIDQREPYTWPDGKKLAFYACNNIEIFSFGSGLGANVGLELPAPNHRSYAWRDYGNRVGLTRLLDLFDELNLPFSHNVNSLLYQHCPQIFERMRKRGDEIIGHGRTNAERQSEMDEETERKMIQEVTDTIAAHEGKRPAGWLGPWLAETYATPDLLHEAGYSYLLDWACDDQPIWMTTRKGKILSVPYPIELNDSPAIVYRNFTGRDFADMIVDQFDQMIEECERRPLVFALALHTFIVGQPHRATPLRKALRHCQTHPKADRVWWTRPGEIASYCLQLPPGIIPGS